MSVTVALDFADKADDGTLRLLVNTDVPYSDEAADSYAKLIEGATALVQRIASFTLPDECEEHEHDVFACFHDEQRDCCTDECVDQVEESGTWDNDNTYEALARLIDDARALAVVEEVT